MFCNFDKYFPFIFQMSPTENRNSSVTCSALQEILKNTEFFPLLFAPLKFGCVVRMTVLLWSVCVFCFTFAVTAESGSHWIAIPDGLPTVSLPPLSSVESPPPESSSPSWSLPFLNPSIQPYGGADVYNGSVYLNLFYATKDVGKRKRKNERRGKD